MDDESKLTLHGLVQHYIMLHEDEKNRKLNDLLDALDFNQVGGLLRELSIVTIINPTSTSLGSLDPFSPVQVGVFFPWLFIPLGRWTAKRKPPHPALGRRDPG